MKATRNILFPIVSFTIASVIFLFFVVQPIFQGVLSDHEETLAEKLKFVQVQQDRKHLQDFRAVFASSQNEFAQLDQLFLDTQTPIEFFRFLETTSASFQIRLEQNPGIAQQKKGDPWPSMDIQIQGNGSYPNLVAFLEKVENAPYLSEITDISIISPRAAEARGQGITGENILSMTLKVYTK